jgi:hypothetical protein
MRGSIRFLENILFFGPYNSEYDYLITVCIQANSTHQISQSGKCSSNLCSKITGSLVERN